MTGGCWWSRDMQPAISNKKTNQFFSLEWEELFVFICCGLRLPKRMNERSKSGLAGLTLGGLVAAQPHGNQPKEKTSSPLELSGFTSRGAQPAQPQTNNPISLPLPLQAKKWSWLVGLNWFVCFSFGSWNEFIGGLRAAQPHGNQPIKKRAPKGRQMKSMKPSAATKDNKR